MLGKCSSISRVWQAWFVPRAPLWQGRKIAWQKLEFVTYVFFNFYFASHQGRIKGAQRGDCPGPPVAKGPPWWNLFVSNKILVSKIFVIQNNSILYSYIPLSIKGPQQQLISLQVWLSASFSNRYWIACKYFRFCSVQICLVSLVTFS